ncbi:MAG: adenosylcobinamide-GDP ribazoletransferase [Streptosporangiaceae bacterium]|jgi:adenosylcobinamide-GDP ribazoletransferase|nr:adenosylcobinamide-GDP ribazoletransferase [Streptosporangiaceae bacterium]
MTDAEKAQARHALAGHAQAGHAQASMTARARAPRPWRVALSLFTVIPAGVPGAIRRDMAAKALPWLPAVGALVAAVAAGAMLAVQAGGQSEGRRLLAATLAVAILGLLTGGLHLDGLADTADGLGSRRPRREALAIMRRPDIGPMGVAALLLVILLQITALAAIPPGGLSIAALVLAAVTGRVAVVLATGPGSPSARPGGFGALITDTTAARVRVAAVAALLAAVAAAGFLLGAYPQATLPLGRGAGAARGDGPAIAARWLVATLLSLLAAELLRRMAKRRLGGMTGDVYGAVIEVCTATVLLVLALSS